jgi:hypothetical protein
MSNAVIALGSLVLMLVLIWAGMHVAVVLGWCQLHRRVADQERCVRGRQPAGRRRQRRHQQPHLRRRAAVRADRFPGRHGRCRQGRLRGRQPGLPPACAAAWASPPWRPMRCSPRSPASRSHRPRCSPASPYRRCCASATAATFATGVVAGSSVLGMLIPPSLLMILYGFLSEPVGGRHVHRRHRARPDAGSRLRLGIRADGPYAAGHGVLKAAGRSRCATGTLMSPGVHAAQAAAQRGDDRRRAGRHVRRVISPPPRPARWGPCWRC